MLSKRKDNPAAAREQTGGEYFEWSTDEAPPAQRLDVYVGQLCERIMNVTASSTARDDFRARLTAAQLGPLHVSAMSGSQQDSYRRRSHVARSKEHAYHLALGQGPWKFSHGNSTLHLGPGDLVFADTRIEYSANWPADHFALNVRLPTEWLHSWIPDPGKLVGKLISNESGWGRLLSNYISRIPPEVAACPPLAATVMSDQVGALLALAATEIPGCVPQSRPNYPVQHARILESICERCSELELTAGDIASTFGVSPRTVHRLLASYGETFGKKLMDARIDVATRMLESRMFARVTIAEIGRRAGFMDPSHFARVFRSRLGLTPSRYRRVRLER